MFQQGETKGHPIAYTHALLPDGRIFIPTRHEHGQHRPSDSNTTFGQIVHNNVRCDGCSAAPIRGIRYKCAMCDDFNYCSTCYMANKDGHKDAHYFNRMEKPVHYYSNMPLANAHAQDHLDFDHSIYLINCTLLSSMYAITNIVTAETHRLEHHKTTTCLHAYFPTLLSIQKVTIKSDANQGWGSGPFKRIVNDDYYAYPIWK
jgi:Zinc finger, ZZ type